MSETDWRRWKGLRGHVTYWKGWAAYQVLRPLPLWRMPYWSYAWLLPSYGDYVEWEHVIELMNEASS